MLSVVQDIITLCHPSSWLSLSQHYAVQMCVHVAFFPKHVLVSQHHNPKKPMYVSRQKPKNTLLGSASSLYTHTHTHVSIAFVFSTWHSSYVTLFPQSLSLMDLGKVLHLCRVFSNSFLLLRYTRQLLSRNCSNQDFQFHNI